MFVNNTHLLGTFCTCIPQIIAQVITLPPWNVLRRKTFLNIYYPSIELMSNDYLPQYPPPQKKAVLVVAGGSLEDIRTTGTYIL